MITKIEVMKCDIRDCNSEDNVKTISMQVIFVTEQNEGRGCKPYFQNAKFEMCQKCLEKALDGNAVYAAGAQGYNEFYFKSKSKK